MLFRDAAAKIISLRQQLTEARERAETVTANAAQALTAAAEALEAERAAHAAEVAKRCESCGEYDPGYCNLRGHQVDFDMTCPRWRKREAHDE